MRKFKQGIALLCGAAMLSSLVVSASAAEVDVPEAAGKETAVEEPAERLLLGRVVSINEDGTVTVELGGGHMGRGMGPGGRLDNSGGELPELEDGELPELPEKPERSDAGRPERQEQQELPDEEREELPDGEVPEKMTRTITLSAEEVEGLDLEVGTVVSVSFVTDEDGNEAVTLTVMDDADLPALKLPDGMERPEDGELPEGQDKPGIPGRAADGLTGGMAGGGRTQGRNGLDGQPVAGSDLTEVSAQGRMAGEMTGGPKG